MECALNPQQVTLKGHGNYNARTLETSHASLFRRGQGGAHLWVKEQLQLNLGEHNHIELLGEPTVSQTSLTDIQSI